MICLIALLLKNKKLVCLLSCRQAYWIIDMIHSISKVYTPPDATRYITHSWIFTQYQRYIHLSLSQSAVGYSLNINGIYTARRLVCCSALVGYSLNINGICTVPYLEKAGQLLDIYSISMVYTPVYWNTLNSNRISQKLSEFFECLDVGNKPV